MLKLKLQYFGHLVRRGSGAGTLGVPLGGTRRVGGLLGVAGRLSGTVSPLMYRLMYTRALLQSEDHSVGSKRYLSRLEKRVESFASPRDEA